MSIASLLLLWTALAVGPPLSSLLQQQFPPGEVVEDVVSLSDPSQSYAVYLPSAYGPHREWPVLFAMDPRGRARVPLDLFREAAERHGYIIVSFVLSVVAAVVGGFVCAAIAKNLTACYVLAGIVLVLGLLMTIPVLTGSYEGMPEIRDGSVGNFEAMQYARHPAWIALLNPIIGAGGIVFGARFKIKPVLASVAA